MPPTVELNAESFQSSPDQWSWSTPGAHDRKMAWTPRVGPTPTTAAGPSGGANPSTRAVEASNGYVHTEASDTTGPWSLESPTFDASAGRLTLTFDLHMRFGSVGGIDDGTLQVQGWNGSSWQDIGAEITGSQQRAADDDYIAAGPFDSSTFNNADFKFRLLASKGAGAPPNYDFAVDNAVITGPDSAAVNGPDNPVVTEPPTPGLSSGTARRAAALGTGRRTVFVSKNGKNSNSGLSEAKAKKTIQAAADILKAGDVMIVDDGVYFERPRFKNINGTASSPVWIAARNPGRVTISDEWRSARDGTQDWTPSNDGSGIFSAAHGDVYVGSHEGDFLLCYRSRSALKAAAVLGTKKPPYGLAFENGRVFIRLRGKKNPNGRSIKITQSFGRPTVTFDNAHHCIIDGFRIEGSGNAPAIEVNRNCKNPTITNNVSTLSRFLCRVGSNAIVDYNHYSYAKKGFGDWCEEVNALNPGKFNAFFTIVKKHFVKPSNRSNALLEGGIVAAFSGSTDKNLVCSRNYIESVFDGSRFGDFKNSDEFLNIFERTGDDCVQFEISTAAVSQGGGLRHFNNRYINPFGPVHSHQGQGMKGDQFVFRNVMEVTDPSKYQQEFVIKMIKTPGSCKAHHFHNLYRLTKRSDPRFLWFAFSNGTADRVINFRNNLIISDANIPNGAGPRPKKIEGNVYAGPSANSTVQGTGGGFAGSGQAAMGLKLNFALKPGSPAKNKGRNLPAFLNNADELIGGTPSTVDAGPFPIDFDPGPDWPRPRKEAFNEDRLPARWRSQSP
ncbi:MAG: hypothetical protein OEU92_18165 [Alphaproteobacteria bacterium]|nr:hypothetical protein [Alphaproteobacteria bacterium]